MSAHFTPGPWTIAPYPSDWDGALEIVADYSEDTESFEVLSDGFEDDPEGVDRQIARAAAK